MRTVQKCISARFLVARQPLGGDVPEKNFLLKRIRIRAGGSHLIWAMPKRKGVFFLGIFPKYNENVEKLIAPEKKVFHIKVGVDH